ncbi:MAG TPA: DUF202 domain-containing protein [Rhizomicrobium sp.]|jgi:putative membrane protein
MSDIEKAAGKIADTVDLSTQLAADRTVFAGERTYSAWVRTGLAALASAVGAKSLLAHVVPDWEIVLAGAVLALFSAFCFAAAVWRECIPGVIPSERSNVPRIPSVILIAVNGTLVFVALGVLANILLSRLG